MIAKEGRLFYSRARSPANTLLADVLLWLEICLVAGA